MFDYRKLLRSCERKLTAEVGQAGSATMISPILSVFMGPDAQANKDYVKDTFEACWEGSEGIFEYLDASEYASKSAHSAINRMLTMNERFAPKNMMVNIAVFLDMSDPHFDDDFARLQDLPPVMSVFSVRIVIFALFRFDINVGGEPFPGCFKDRLERIEAWSQDTDALPANFAIRTICLSDLTNRGYLDEKGWLENYRICCDVMIVLNSATSTGRFLGNNLELTLKRHPCCSAAYASAGKNNRAIAATILSRTVEGLRRYSRLRAQTDVSLESRIDPEDPQKFSHFFDEYYRRIAVTLDDGARAALQYVPFTNAVEQLQDVFNPKPLLTVNLKGLLPKLNLSLPKINFHQKVLTVDAEAPSLDAGFTGKRTEIRDKVTAADLCVYTDAAMDSLLGYEDEPDFLDLFMRRYLPQGEVSQGLTLDANQLKQDIEQRLSSSFSYEEMANWMRDKANEIERTMELDSSSGQTFSLTEDAQAPLLMADCSNYYECLAVGIELMRKHEIVSGKMIGSFIEALRELGARAEGFSEELVRFERANAPEMSESVRKAYGAYTDKLIEEHADELFSSFVPQTGEDFSTLLETLFDAILSYDRASGKSIFFQTISNDIDFLVRSSPEIKANSVIADTFNANLTDTPRMLLDRGVNLSEGARYRLVGMSDGIPDSPEEETIPAPWSDKVERLSIYPIDTRYVRWS